MIIFRMKVSFAVVMVDQTGETNQPFKLKNNEKKPLSLLNTILITLSPFTVNGQISLVEMPVADLNH